MLIKYIQTLFTLGVGLATHWVTPIFFEVTGREDTTHPVFRLKYSFPQGAATG